jgi:hypothetical protein
MVFAASLWGGPDTNMDWLDGMTGCTGSCNIKNSSVNYYGFRLTPNSNKAEAEYL